MKILLGHSIRYISTLYLLKSPTGAYISLTPPARVPNHSKSVRFIFECFIFFKAVVLVGV